MKCLRSFSRPPSVVKESGLGKTPRHRYGPVDLAWPAMKPGFGGLHFIKDLDISLVILDEMTCTAQDLLIGDLAGG